MSLRSARHLGAPADYPAGKYFSEIPAKILESQAVPANQGLWDFAKAEDFWAQRAVTLASSFNAFLRSAFDGRRNVG